MSDTEKPVEDPFLVWLGEFLERRTEQCWTCKGPIAHLDQVGRCVYARPCGCRLWRGEVPKAWRRR